MIMTISVSVFHNKYIFESEEVYLVILVNMFIILFWDDVQLDRKFFFDLLSFVNIHSRNRFEPNFHFVILKNDYEIFQIFGVRISSWQFQLW